MVGGLGEQGRFEGGGELGGRKRWSRKGSRASKGIGKVYSYRRTLGYCR